MCHRGAEIMARARATTLGAPPSRALGLAYKGNGYKGGGRSYHGRDTTSLMTISRRWDRLFFGGSSSGSLRGVLPFSGAENLCIGTMAYAASEGTRNKKEQEKRRKRWVTGAPPPLPIYSQGEANRRPP